MHYLEILYHAHITVHSPVCFSWEKVGSRIFRGLFQKVTFKTISLYPAHIYSLVAATLDMLPIAHHSFTCFPALLKRCLERLIPLHVARWPRGRAGREQATTLMLLVAPPAKSAHEQGHPPHHKEHKWGMEGFIPCVEWSEGCLYSKNRASQDLPRRKMGSAWRESEHAPLCLPIWSHRTELSGRI